jgi:PBSX family phage terminase large subunit
MLSLKLLPKQWEVFRPDDGVHYDIKLYQGGVGSGKTFLGSLTGLSVLAANPGATWLVGADTYARLKITTCETYESLLDDAKVRYKHNKSDHIIRIPGWDDARIIFKGVDDPQALRSVNGIGGHLEEASMLTEASYLEFLGRLRQGKEGDAIRLILTTNPQPTKGWLYHHFVENAGVKVEEVRGNEIRVSQRRVIARTLDNPHVSDAFIASLKASYDEELWKIMVLGQDGDYTRGLVSYNFSELNKTQTEYKSDLEIYLSCDFNVDPMSWALAHRYNGEYHFFDEIVIANTNINECVDEFVRRYPSHEKPVVITGDASGNARNVQNADVGGTSYTQMINRFNFHNYPAKVRVDVREKNPPIADRIAAWNSMMCNTNGIRRIFINTKCKRLIYNLENLKYQEGSSVIDAPTSNDIKKDPNQKYMGHIFDAASYLVEKYDSVMLRPNKVEQSVSVPNALSKHLRGR